MRRLPDCRSDRQPWSIPLPLLALGRRAGLAALLLCLGIRAAQAGVCLSIAAEVEALYDIPRPLLQAIIITESGDNPYALNIDGQAFYPADFLEAHRLLTWGAAQAGNTDVGCGQISLRHHGRFFGGSPEQALNPQFNVVYAARFLGEMYRRHGSWAAAVAYYHSADPVRQRAYVCRVIANVGRLLGRMQPCATE